MKRRGRECDIDEPECADSIYRNWCPWAWECVEQRAPLLFEHLQSFGQDAWKWRHFGLEAQHVTEKLCRAARQLFVYAEETGSLFRTTPTSTDDGHLLTNVDLRCALHAYQMHISSTSLEHADALWNSWQRKHMVQFSRRIGSLPPYSFDSAALDVPAPTL